jgi:hypothetical protein
VRDLPADIAAQVLPPPKWFTIHPHLNNTGLALRWAMTVQTPNGPLELEYGLPIRSGSAGEMAQLTEALRHSAWQILELVRLHQLRLVDFARVDRHENRPARARPLTDEAHQLLADVQAAHAARLEGDASAAARFARTGSADAA